MGATGNSGERLRRATALWHGYLAVTGQRFELAQFLKDSTLENQVVAKSLASGNQKLLALVQEWLVGNGRAPPAAVTRTISTGAPPAEPQKPTRYLRGVR